ncbi:hypothetical protein ACFE04_024396 [Oxalis oulophora]
MSRQKAAAMVDNIYNNTTTLLHYLSTTSSLSHIKQSHAHLIKTNINNNNNYLLSTKLISLYANLHHFTQANLLLSSLPNPKPISSFSTLIYAYTKHSLYNQSLHLFSQMLSLSLPPDTHLLPTLFKACAALSALAIGSHLHCIACVLGLHNDPFVQSSLIHMYIKCGLITDARKLFDRLFEWDVVTCSALLAGYAKQGKVDEAIEVFQKMRKGFFGVELNLVSWNGMIVGFRDSGNFNQAVLMFRWMHSDGFLPDGTSISSVLTAVGELEFFNVGIQIHGCVIKLGYGGDKYVVTALVNMYDKCRCADEMSRVFDDLPDLEIGACNALVTGLSRNGLVEEALRVFNKFQKQGMDLNVVSWTSIIASCSQNGKDIEALELFREMQSSGVRPNAITIPSLLPACGNIAALLHGKAIHCFSLRTSISEDVYVGSALVDMYANCGRIRLSQLFFENMPSKNLVCWNAMMNGYAMHGKAKEAIEIFDLMQRKGQKPDSVSFVSLLSACSQVGLLDEGKFFFDSMSRVHGIEPKLEHYASMITLLGRAGKLDEAYTMIKQMKYEPDACVWGALLSTARIQKSLAFGEVAAKKLFMLEPHNPGNYVLLSNIYASKGMWAEVDNVRGTMVNKGLRKNPGCSWIEVKRKVHMLLAGDKSHPQMMQISEKLNELGTKMKESGYIPDTEFVMQDVEEQDKEQILCGHSEKLAVVFGILNTSPGTPLQVTKNLRICGDCHAVIKFISIFEGREIFVRDTNRYHHFKDGHCSCGDYW